MKPSLIHLFNDLEGFAMPAFLRINPADNVAVALEPLAAGTVLSLPEGNVAAVEEIPAGHKIALCDIAEGENIIK